MSAAEVNSPAQSSNALVANASNGKAIVELYEGGSSNGNVYINTSDGKTKIKLGSNVDSYINTGKSVGINNTSPSATLDVSGSFKTQTATFTKIPSASSAPSGADLEALVIDKSTGIIYMQ